MKNQLFDQPAETTYQDIIKRAAVPPRGYKRYKDYKMPDIKICRFKMLFISHNDKRKIVPSLDRKHITHQGKKKLVIDEQDGLVKLIRLATGLEENQWGKYLKAAHIYMSLDKTPLLKDRKYDLTIMSLYAHNIVHTFERDYGTLHFHNSNVNLKAVRQLLPKDHICNI